MATSLLQTLLSLIAVVALILVLGVAARHLRNLRGSRPAGLEIEAGLQLGGRERLLLVRAEGRRFLVGVAPGSVRLLHGFEPGDSFRDHLPPS